LERFGINSVRVLHIDMHLRADGRVGLSGFIEHDDRTFDTEPRMLDAIGLVVVFFDQLCGEDGFGKGDELVGVFDREKMPR